MNSKKHNGIAFQDEGFWPIAKKAFLFLIQVCNLKSWDWNRKFIIQLIKCHDETLVNIKGSSKVWLATVSHDSTKSSQGRD